MNQPGLALYSTSLDTARHPCTVREHSNKCPGNPVPLRRRFRPAGLLDQVRERLRYGHYSLSAERSYVYWVRWLSALLGRPWLALIFLYKQLLEVDLPWQQEIGQPRAAAPADSDEPGRGATVTRGRDWRAAVGASTSVRPGMHRWRATTPCMDWRDAPSGIRA